MRQVAARVLFVVGVCSLVLGLFAGLANREVVNSQNFAAHVDSIRQDPDVARQLGLIVSDRIIDASPELVALRPLLESVSIATVASPALSPVVRRATVPIHNALATGEGEVLVLRLVDVAAVTIAGLKTVAPQVVANIPDDMSVRLADIGATPVDRQLAKYFHWVRVLSWLLPLLGLIALIASALLGRRSWAQLAFTFGRALLWLAGAVITVILVMTILAALVPTDTLNGAIAVASWHEIDGRLWIIALVCLIVGLLLRALGSVDPLADLDDMVASVRRFAVDRPRRVGALAGRGGALVLIGVFAVLRPTYALTVLAIVVGVLALFLGARDLIDAVQRWASAAFDRRGGALRALRPLASVVLAAAVIAAAIFYILPQDNGTAGLTALRTDPNGCNGHVELCDRKYTDVAFPATHNSMSAQDEPGWFIAEQPTGVMGQLNDGIRVFLIDSWYGQMSDRPPTIANTPETRAEAMAQAQETYGADVVNSALRVRNSLNLTPVGPVHPYLCHELCELGSTEWLPLMKQVNQWLDDHPREVVTFFVQDIVRPPDVDKLLHDAGMYDKIYTPQLAHPWPTLQQMIDSNRRVVWLHENIGGGTQYPWLLDGHIWVQDTPYTFRSAADFSCAHLRGVSTAPIFLVNHWLSNFTARIHDAKIVNQEDVLLPRLEQCRSERGMIPNFVAVDNYGIGDLFAAVDQINGVS
ncbi:hypothetical protein AAFP30_10935 [Gordonia sp. CPCC 205515]|uniref:hypothetical protein n=1 Tax=Gordonia sp. CPCC 205515 TaxID=3140791 RepID=UPI003AF3B21D